MPERRALFWVISALVILVYDSQFGGVVKSAG